MNTQENNSMYSRFRQIGEGSVRFTCTREEMFDFIKSEIHISEQSLVERVREEIEKMMPDYLTQEEGEIYHCEWSIYHWGKNILSLPILKTTTPDGDNQ